MAIDFTVRKFPTKPEFSEHINFFDAHRNSLDVVEASDPLTLVEKVCILEDVQRLKRLSNYYYQLLDKNLEFLNFSDYKVVSLITALDPYHPKLRQIYEIMLKNSQSPVEEIPQLKKTSQPESLFTKILTSRGSPPLSISDASSQCFLREENEKLSLSEALKICCFLYFQASEKEALIFANLHIFPYCFENPEKFTEEVGQLWPQEIVSLDKLEAGSKIDQSQVIGQIIKKRILQSPEFFSSLPDLILDWILSESILKDSGELDCLLGNCHWYGRGFEQNSAEALKHFTKAAALGCARAYIGIGHCYWLGSEVLQSDAEALRNFTIAAELGCADAYVEIGYCHWYGRGTVQSDVEALRNFTIGAELGCAEAYVEIGYCHWYGRGIVQNAAEALRNFTTAAELGCSAAYLAIGRCHWYGRGVLQSDAEALRNFMKAAKLGCASAYLEIGYFHLYGRDGTQNATEAFKNYIKAAELGCSEAYVEIGYCHSFGRGVLEDPVKAFEFYEKSMSLGQRQGKLMVAQCLTLGKGIAQDLPKAKKLLEELILSDQLQAANFYAKHFV